MADHYHAFNILADSYESAEKNKMLKDCQYNHGSLIDHNLCIFNVCTDNRAWSLDERQKRQHFNDLIGGRIPHCGDGDAPQREKEELKSKDPPVAGPSKVPTKNQVPTKVKEVPPKKEKEKKPKEEVIKAPVVKKDKTDIETPETGIHDLIALRPPEDVILTSDSSEEKLGTKNRSEEFVPSVTSEEKLPYETCEELLLSLKSKKQLPSVKDKEQRPSVKDKEQQPSVKDKEQRPSVKSKEQRPSVTSEEQLPYVKSKEQRPSVTSKEQRPSVTSKESEKLPTKTKDALDQEPKDVVDLTDELIEKLDRNLRNLEATFDKFVRKNRDFISNLVECLDFEKQKQKSLEDEYNKLKQENEELKTQNDYLKMVNNKQLGLFKNELDRGISESKVIYKRKIHLMERQLQNDQDELQMYKQTEKKYMEVVEQDNEKIEKLNNKIEDLKNKEVQLVRNYLKLLKFLENVKEILSGADPKEIPQLHSLNTITDSGGENDPNVRRVLRNALNEGISTLNVRDLSILHDAIEDLNDSLCHQTDKCTKSPTANSSLGDFSSMTIHRLVIEHSHDDTPKFLEDYDTSSNLSIYPTKQKPEARQVHFN